MLAEAPIHFEQILAQYEVLCVVAPLGHKAENKAARTEREQKVRQRRKWFSRKYYASVMNIKEFYEDNIGHSFTGIIADFARRCNCHK